MPPGKREFTGELKVSGKKTHHLTLLWAILYVVSIEKHLQITA